MIQENSTISSPEPPNSAPRMPWSDKVILAPMSKGSCLPYRRLCASFGAKVTVSEMVFASQLMRGMRKDLALMRRFQGEECFGVQILASKPEEAAQAALIAAKQGADFVDLNAGCPIREAVSKGCGSHLVDRPRLFERVMQAMIRVCPVPVTVKLRIGFAEDKINVLETSRLAEEAGVSGIAVHGRTAHQRYTGCANWNVIKEVVQARHLPIVGNGDILTWYEAEDKMAQSGVYGIMPGRGALIKPWIFQEIKEKRTLNLSAEERLEIYAQYAAYLLDHFGDDEFGHKRALGFLSWHFDFFTRWRYLPETEWREKSRQHPLLQTRMDRPQDPDPLSQALGCSLPQVHNMLAQATLDSLETGRGSNWLAEAIRSGYQSIMEEEAANRDNRETALDQY